MSKPLILGFDTSAAHFAAALVQGDICIAAGADTMTRGQAEHLMPMLEDLLGSAAKTWSDLDAIAVGIGPGNFTGIRISVSAARGLALGLKIPAIGVTTFEASTWNAREDCIAVVPAPRDQIYVQDPARGVDPFLTPAPYESKAPQVTPPKARILATNIALCAGMRLDHPLTAPAPLYIRAADAAPSRDIPPKLL